MKSFQNMEKVLSTQAYIGVVHFLYHVNYYPKHENR